MNKILSGQITYLCHLPSFMHPPPEKHTCCMNVQRGIMSIFESYSLFNVPLMKLSIFQNVDIIIYEDVVQLMKVYSVL